MLTTERVVTERRQAPRVTVKGLAYVNLDRDNGGIILDVSEGGLCFQATAPVQCVEKVRLWFSYRSPRTQADPEHGLKKDGQTRDIPGFVETESELTWTDDTRKRGGLKFKNLSAEARSQIRDWIRQPSLANVNEKSTASFPSMYKRPFLNAKRGETTVAAADSSRLDSSRSHAL